jgi:hypothetical protein
MEGNMKHIFRIAFTLLLIVVLLLAFVIPVLAAPLKDAPPGIAVTPTPEMLALIAGVVLSLVFSYVPGLNVKFAALDPTYKRLIMLGLLVLTAGAVFGLSCASVLTGVTCDQPGLMQLVTILILSVIANQSTFAISPLTNAVQIAKLTGSVDAGKPPA